MQELSAGFASSMEKVFQDDEADRPGEWELCGSPGQVVNLQVVVRCAEPQRGVCISLRPWVGDVPGRWLSSDSCRIWHVGHVPVGCNSEGVEELLRPAPALFPDPLSPRTPVEMAPDRAETFWISYRIPPDAPAGQYHSLVAVQTPRGEVVLPLRLRVFGVPEETPLPFETYFLMHLRPIPRCHGVEYGSEAYWSVIENYARLYQDYRFSMIFVPWTELVTFRKEGEQWVAEVDDLERFIAIFHRHGMRKFVLKHIAWRDCWETDYLYTMPYRVTCGSDFTYRAPRKTREDPEFPAITAAYLRSVQRIAEKYPADVEFYSHLTDEPLDMHLSLVDDLVGLVRAHAPRCKVLEGVQVKELERLSGKVDVALLPWGWRDEKWSGLPMSIYWYICLQPKGKWPNRFIDQALIRYRIVPWLIWKHKLEGYAEWGLNSWGNGQWYYLASMFDPWHGAAPPFQEHVGRRVFPYLPPGDAYLTYPDGERVVPSIRLETLREGLQDAGWLYRLDAALAADLPAELAESGERLRREILHRIIPGDENHTRDIPLLEEYRARLGAWLEQAHAARGASR